MADKLVLRIEPDGSVVFLSGSGIEEALDMRTFGPMKAERAASIQFDERTQTWGWVSSDGRVPVLRGHGFKTRREAVAAEIAAMSKLL